MRRLLLALTTAIAVLGLTGVAWAAAPTATNAMPTNLGANTVTLNGNVTTGGEATTARFDYSTSIAGPYTSTPAQNVADGPVTANVTGLTPGVTYYFQLFASNATQPNVGPGFDNFVTEPAQLVVTNPFTNLTATSADISGTVNPNGLATQARFRYGTTTGSQQFTPVTPMGDGNAAVPIAASLTGLTPFTRYYYTVRSDRSAPIADPAIEGTQLSFVTDRALTGISAKASRVTYGGTSTISGTVSGGGTSGVNLVVQAQPYPYDGAFTTVLEGKTASNGSYSLRLGNNLKNTKIRVLTSGSSVVISPVTTLYVETRVGLTIKKKGSKRVFTGTVRPKLGSAARAKVQRKSGKKWITVRTLKLTTQSSASSRYTTTLSRRKNTSYRVQVSSGSQSYATGVSTTRKVK